MDPDKLHRLFAQEQERLFGQRALRRGWITLEQLKQALADQASGNPNRIGEILVARGWMKAEQVMELVREVPPEAAAHLNDPARTIAEFVLVETIGQGGLSVVWKAWDRALHRWVAVKVPSAPLDLELWQRFQREAQAASHLSHPNIVPVYRVAEEAGRPYIVMQWIDGRAISKIKLSTREALEVVRSAAAAVHSAHLAGVVHRDLKPDNLMRDASNNVWILDFGLAFLNEGRRRLTSAGSVFGTPSYMSPEQARGEDRARGPATDIYSLGATLYELVTGVAPFEGETVAEIVHKVISTAPVPPRRLNPEIPAGVETVILKALEKDPARRYSTAADMADDLRRCLAGEPVAARRPIRKPLLAAAAVLVAALVIVFSWPSEPPIRTEPKTAALYVEVQDRVSGAKKYLYKPGGTIEDIRRELEPVLPRLRQTPQADGYYLQGRVYHLLGDAASARTCFDLALELDPNHALSHVYLARLLLERSVIESSLLLDEKRFRARLEEMVDEARVHLEQASSSAGIDPKDFELAKGYRLLASRKFTEVLSLAREARDEEFKFLAGLACLGQDRYDEAISHFTAAIEGRANYFEAYYMRGGCHEMSGRFEAAVADFKTCLKIHPDYPFALNNLGVRYEKLGEYGPAVECLSRAIAVDPNFVNPYINLGSVFTALRRFDDALLFVDRALKIDPLYYAAYFQRGLTFFESGRLGAARDGFNLCLELYPNHVRALAVRGEVYLQWQKPEEAIRDFSAALALVPEWSLYHNRAQARMMRGGWAEAVDDLTQAIAHNEKSAVSYFTRGTAKMRLGKYADAVLDFEQAIKLDRRLLPSVNPQLAEARRRLRSKE